jgi:hypothetical protein
MNMRRCRTWSRMAQGLDDPEQSENLIIHIVGTLPTFYFAAGRFPRAGISSAVSDPLPRDGIITCQARAMPLPSNTEPSFIAHRMLEGDDGFDRANGIASLPSAPHVGLLLPSEAGTSFFWHWHHLLLPC